MLHTKYLKVNFLQPLLTTVTDIQNINDDHTIPNKEKMNHFLNMNRNDSKNEVQIMQFSGLLQFSA